MDKFIVNIGRNFQLFKISLSSVIAAACGFLSAFLGGVDTLLVSLVTMIIIDYATGVIRAIYQKKLSSAVGFKGIIKKLFILLMVGLSVTLQNVLPSGIPLREITILFFIANEGFSILENASGIIPLPKKIRSVLAQIQQESERKEEEDSLDSDSDEETLKQADPELKSKL